MEGGRGVMRSRFGDGDVGRDGGPNRFGDKEDELIRSMHAGGFHEYRRQCGGSISVTYVSEFSVI